MGEFVLVVIGLAAAFAVPALWARIRADEAESAGELRYWARAFWSEQVIRRADDPRQFEIEIRILRALPWMIGTAIAFAILVFGSFA